MATILKASIYNGPGEEGRVGRAYKFDKKSFCTTLFA